MTIRYLLAVSGSPVMYIQYCWTIEADLELHLISNVMHAAIYETQEAADADRVKIPIADVIQVVSKEIAYN